MFIKTTKRISYKFALVFSALVLSLSTISVLFSPIGGVQVKADPYGTNNYGECKYGNLYCDMYLAMVFRDSADTVNVNECDLGSASNSTVSTCQYRVKIDTNAKNGYTLYVKTSGDFANGAYNIPNASAGTGGTGGTDVSNGTAGTEAYGVVIDQGQVTGETVPSTPVLASIFDAGGTNAVQYDYTTDQLLLTSTDINRPGSPDLVYTMLFTHKFNITTLTPPGEYAQTVTYTLNPSF